eukprot:jgi/Mesvir1/28878/Mv17973-RA.1
MGGVTGGWDEDDHKHFLKLLAGCQNDYADVVDAALAAMSHHDRDDIIAHCRWHAEYEDLLYAKKAAIQRWRAMKQAEREEARNRVVEAESVQVAREAAERKQHEQSQQRLEKKSKVTEWKELKQAEREKQLQEEAERLRQQQEWAVAERRQRQEEAKLALAHLQWARQQAAAVHQAAQEEAAEQKRREQAALRKELAKRREKDMELLEQKEARERERKAAERERLDRLERAVKKVEVPRDPHRLLRLTEAADHRVRDTEAEGGGGLFASKVINPRTHSMRAVPTWRKAG